MNTSFGFEPASRRVWRSDRGALAAGVCAGIAEDLDLPLTLVRVVSLMFLVLPTGLAYLALALLLRRRPGSMTARAPNKGGAVPAGDGWALLRHRFETLEPRLGRIEAFVSAADFELHRDFRRMGQ